MSSYRFLLLGLIFLLSSCATKPPGDIDNLCHIVKQHPRWYLAARDVAHRWKVPISVQMAIIHQESKFDGVARPKRKRLLGVIPWRRPSSSYGYTQALSTTWRIYKNSDDGRRWSSRSDFNDAVDFIGWYINQAHRRAGIPRDDAYHLYLAYHEGISGYQHKTYLKKPWVIQVAKKVNARAKMYHAQLVRCR